MSNGSSSCGRAGVNTGGRGNPHSTNAFSPLLNTMMTPNNQPRLEELEQLYDEILDEEEEFERKMLKIQKRKQKKLNGMEEDSEEGDDESIYEEEEDYEELHPTMSFEEDIDDLQSYRHPQNAAPVGQTEFLNESTADFNKEIR